MWESMGFDVVRSSNNTCRAGPWYWKIAKTIVVEQIAVLAAEWIRFLKKIIDIWDDDWTLLFTQCFP